MRTVCHYDLGMWWYVYRRDRCSQAESRGHGHYLSGAGGVQRVSHFQYLHWIQPHDGAAWETDQPQGSVYLCRRVYCHYWLALYTRLKKDGYQVVILNPIQTHTMREMFLRKSKTDIKDSLLYCGCHRLRLYPLYIYYNTDMLHRRMGQQVSHSTLSLFQRKLSCVLCDSRHAKTKPGVD